MALAGWLVEKASRGARKRYRQQGGRGAPRARRPARTAPLLSQGDRDRTRALGCRVLVARFSIPAQ